MSPAADEAAAAQGTGPRSCHRGEHSHVTASGAPQSSARGLFVSTFGDLSSSGGFSFFGTAGRAGGRGSAGGTAGIGLGGGREGSATSARETGLEPSPPGPPEPPARPQTLPTAPVRVSGL